MRQEKNNEMDLLLRRLSRQLAGSSSQAAGEHLDADELSSYAENALPAAARTRYTEHLAECSRCRELVVSLSGSVGVVAAEGKSTVLGPSGFRKFLASLFSPMVLRYAVPALGLMVVAVIGLVVFQSTRNAPFTAQLDSASPRPATQIVQPEAPVTLTDQQEKSASTADMPENRTNKSKETQPDANAAAPPVATTGEGLRESPVVRSEQQPIANAPPAPQPTPASTAKFDESKQVIELQAAKPSPLAQLSPGATVTSAAAEVRKAEDRRYEGIGTAARPGAAKAKRGTEDSTPAQGRGAIIQRDGAKEKDTAEAEAETRSVAGRRFRKQRGIWIDTAYDSSRSIVSLNRGSEQYRALVADEPELKTIADQLDGEVIVVWKNRTYRIR